MSSPPTDPEQASPDVQDRIRASFEKQGLMRHLGACLGHIGQGRVHILLTRRPEIAQQHGYIHAGATSAIADSAGGSAALTMFGPDTEVLTVAYKINLLAPAGGDHLEAIGTVVKTGRTLTVCQLEVFSTDATRRSMVAVGRRTLVRTPTQPLP